MKILLSIAQMLIINNNYVVLSDSHFSINMMTKRKYFLNLLLITFKSSYLGDKKAILIVCGTGKPLRQFIYSEDLAKLILWVLASYDQIDPIILSVDENDEVEIGHAAKLIANSMAEQLNIPFELEFDTSYSDGQFKKTADNSKLKSLIDTFSFTPFEVGIERSVKWFIDNYENCRK